MRKSDPYSWIRSKCSELWRRGDVSSTWTGEGCTRTHAYNFGGKSNCHLTCTAQPPWPCGAFPFSNIFLFNCLNYLFPWRFSRNEQQSSRGTSLLSVHVSWNGMAFSIITAFSSDTNLRAHSRHEHRARLPLTHWTFELQLFRWLEKPFLFR